MKICHQDCPEPAAGKVRLRIATCGTCMQCIAACRERALSWAVAAPFAADWAWAGTSTYWAPCS